MMKTEKAAPALKCARRTVKIPRAFLDTLKPLYKHATEVGGGINFDDKGKVKNVYYFTSNSNKKIKFDEMYDVEFHAHPLLGKTQRHLLSARRASASDIASTFVSGREEIIFSKGYTFVVRIKDRALFERTKSNIKKRLKGQQFDTIFFMYRAFFSEQEQSIVNKYYDDVKVLNDEWNKEIEKYGLHVERLDNDKIEMSVHGKCAVPKGKFSITRFKDRRKGSTR